jgi:hypothetical protein
VHALTHDLMIFILPIYIYCLARMNKYLLYSGLIFIAVGLTPLVSTSLITTTLIAAILFYRLYELRFTRTGMF